MPITQLDDLGPVGLWSRATADGAPDDGRSLAREYEAAGYLSLWVPEALGYEALTHASLLLHATTNLSVATGIASIWARDAFATHAGTRLLRAAHSDRFVLGLGVSHRLIVDALRGHAYDRPREAMGGYLGQLEELDQSVGDSGPRVIAALGPRMLDLAVEHGTGVLTYLTTVEHTADARTRLGGGHLSVELPIVIAETDEARSVGREHLTAYLGLENYLASLRRLGFTDDDFAGGGSDHLIDAIVAHGTIDDVRVAVGDRLAAGANHVAIHPLDDATMTSVLAATASALR